MPVDAVVLAGRPNQGAFREVSDVPYEALLDVGGRPMVSYVLAALAAAREVGRVAVVGPPQLGELVREHPFLLVPMGETVFDNVQAGLAALEPAGKVLIATSDIPLISGPMVDRFLKQCAARPARLHYPVVRRELAEAKYPLVRRTYVTLADGTFTGGNLFLAEPAAVAAVLEQGRRVFAYRKRPWKLLGLLGWTFMLRYLTHRLTLAQVEARASELLGFPGAAVISPDPEVGVDVDWPQDLQLVRAALG